MTTLKEIAEKYGWTFEEVGQSEMGAGVGRAKDYVFRKGDMTFGFHRRGAGHAHIKIGPWGVEPRALFSHNFSDHDAWQSPGYTPREEFAERVLSRFDRAKLLASVEQELDETSKNFKARSDEASAKLERFRQWSAPVAEGAKS